MDFNPAGLNATNTMLMRSDYNPSQDDSKIHTGSVYFDFQGATESQQPIRLVVDEDGPP